MKSRIYVLAALFVTVFILTGLNTTVTNASPQYRESIVVRHAIPQKLGIPRGHLPPPGSYRMWYPGRPSGRQPVHTYRYEVIRHAPPGAWVLYRPAYNRNIVYVHVIHSRHPGLVRAKHVYDARRGTYIRTERPVRVRYR